MKDQKDIELILVDYEEARKWVESPPQKYTVKDIAERLAMIIATADEMHEIIKQLLGQLEVKESLLEMYRGINEKLGKKYADSFDEEKPSK